MQFINVSVYKVVSLLSYTLVHLVIIFLLRYTANTWHW